MIDSRSAATYGLLRPRNDEVVGRYNCAWLIFVGLWIASLLLRRG